MESQNLNDRVVITAQLGRAPRGTFFVSVRCSYGYPQVIRVHPMIDGKPFPTLYWLTCPFLSREIGHLEAAGWVKQLEARMAEDSELRSAMHRAHRSTCNQRNQLLSADEKAALVAEATLVGLEGRGIGGIADWDRLKCLHLHAAHALADVNPIGSIVLHALPSIECPPQQVTCSAYK
ncbi:DUF501 domain-containing protein [Candidatus Bipolaricaulota bacterium]|nr:DUF501 domain-containing protein [Candidatus Bipolaricaulota bacterium]